MVKDVAEKISGPDVGCGHQDDASHHDDRGDARRPTQATIDHRVGIAGTEVRMGKRAHGRQETLESGSSQIPRRFRSYLVQSFGTTLDAEPPCLQATTKATLGAHRLLA